MPALRTRFVLTSVVIGAIALTTAATMPSAPTAEDPPARSGAPAAAALSFEDAMGQCGRATRRLRRSAFDASTYATDLEQVHALQLALITAKQTIDQPEWSDAATAKFGGDAAAYRAAFRRQLVASLRHAVDLELAVLDGKGADAKKHFTSIKATQKAGHDLFQAE